MVVDLYKKVQELKYTPSDINEHFDAIINYGSECKHITEMGVRSIESTWGWLYTKPEHLICYDIQHPDNLGGSLQDFAETAEAIGTNFSFILNIKFTHYRIVIICIILCEILKSHTCL
jgi:hypothetical protein